MEKFLSTDLHDHNDFGHAGAAVPADYALALETERAARVAEDVLSPRSLDRRRVLLIGRAEAISAPF